MKTKVLLLLLLFSAFASAQVEDFLKLRPRANPVLQGEGTLYRGNDGNIYHFTGGVWMVLGSGIPNDDSVTSAKILDNAITFADFFKDNVRGYFLNDLIAWDEAGFYGVTPGIQYHPESPNQTGRPFIGTLAEWNAATTLATDWLVQTDADPIKVETTATFDLSEKKVYDDTTADAGTITVSGLEAGVEFTVYINRASAPTLAGATWDVLDGTLAFEANVPMIIYGIVHPNKTEINFCYVKL